MILNEAISAKNWLITASLLGYVLKKESLRKEKGQPNASIIRMIIIILYKFVGFSFFVKRFIGLYGKEIRFCGSIRRRRGTQNSV